MSAPGSGKPTLRIRGTTYPVLLPSIRDPRLHLAAVIVSLQILGQVAFEFRLSIAQILVSLLTCAVLEMGIAFRRQHVILWPASALLTGNGVAFILRVPGTEHGDWWSMNGWWIFAGTAAVSLLSKHLIQFRGGHIFNPSNFGLVLCFLLLGPEHADPLEFWWGPMSFWLALALAIIIGGGFAILRRLRLLHIAVTFWVTFVAEHRRDRGERPRHDRELARRPGLGLVLLARSRLLARDPRLPLLHDHRPEDDPGAARPGAGSTRSRSGCSRRCCSRRRRRSSARRSPCSPRWRSSARRGRCSMLLAEAARRRGWDGASPSRRGRASARRRSPAPSSFVGLLVVAGNPARSSAEATVLPASASGELVAVTVQPAQGIAPIDERTAQQIARDLVADLENESAALRRRDRERATAGADGARLAGAVAADRRRRRDAADVPRYAVERVRVSLEPGDGQAPPTVVATRRRERSTRGGATRAAFAETFELVLKDGRYLITAVARHRRRRSRRPRPAPTPSAACGCRTSPRRSGSTSGSPRSGSGSRNEPDAMMGGGLCWLDYDDDGWLDLYVVNAYADDEYDLWAERGGLPRSALFHNVEGRFEDVSRGSGADLQLRGNGCVAADFNQDGHTDLFVTTAGYNVATNGYDALLWGHGDGTFTEGARAAGINDAGLALGRRRRRRQRRRPPRSVRRRLRRRQHADPGLVGRLPVQLRRRARPPLPERRPRRERPLPVPRGRPAGRASSRARVDHGLGAVFTDVDDDGRLDLYVANDLDPNRLYLNVAPTRTPLGFRFVERARRERRRRPERRHGHRRGGLQPRRPRGPVRDELAPAAARRLPQHAEGVRGRAARLRRRRSAATTPAGACRGSTSTSTAISTSCWRTARSRSLHPKQDAERVQVLENLTGEGRRGEFADAGAAVGLPPGQRVNGRGLAAADYDNDGDVDVAVNSIGGPLLLLRNSGARGHWLEVKLDGFAPGTTVTAVLPERPAAGARAPRRQQLPLLRGSARPLRPRRRDAASPS